MGPPEDLVWKESAVQPRATVMIDISELTTRPTCARVNVPPMACSLVRRTYLENRPIWHGHGA